MNEEISHGLVTGVRAQNLGDSLALAATAGDAVLTLYDVADFNEAGGTLRIDDEFVDYSVVNDDANQIALNTVLVSSHDVDTRVDIWDAANNQPNVTYFAVVNSIDGEQLAKPVEAVVRQGVAHSLVQDMRVGAVGESVTLKRSGSELHVDEVHGRTFALASLQYLQGGMTTRQADTDAGIDILGVDSGIPGIYLYDVGGVLAMEITDDAAAGVLKFHTGATGESPGHLNPGLLDPTKPYVDLTSGFTPTNPQQASITLGSGHSGAPAFVATNGDVTFNSANTVDAGSADLFAGDANLNLVHTISGLFADELAGGGTTGASVNNSGRLIRTPSSRRYKSNIKPLSAELARKVLDLEPVTFTLTDEAKAENRGTYPGFIAEQAAEVGLDLWVTRDADGQPDGFRYAELTAALISILRDQQAAIVRLEAIVADL